MFFVVQEIVFGYFINFFYYVVWYYYGSFVDGFGWLGCVVVWLIWLLVINVVVVDGLGVYRGVVCVLNEVGVLVKFDFGVDNVDFWVFLQCFYEWFQNVGRDFGVVIDKEQEFFFCCINVQVVFFGEVQIFRVFDEMYFWEGFFNVVRVVIRRSVVYYDDFY